jgi:hypothetical protein
MPNLRNVNFVAVLGTLLLIVALATSAYGSVVGNPDLIMHAGVTALVGIGLVLLSYRDQ